MPIESKPPEATGNGHAVGVTTMTPKPLAASASSAVSGELHNLLADVQDLIQETTAITSEDFAKAKEKIAERVAAARQSVANVGTAIAEGTRRNAAVADRYVHEQPWAVIGVGVGLGFVCGYLTARRSD